MVKAAYSNKGVLSFLLSANLAGVFFFFLLPNKDLWWLDFQQNRLDTNLTRVRVEWLLTYHVLTALWAPINGSLQWCWGYRSAINTPDWFKMIALFPCIILDWVSVENLDFFMPYLQRTKEKG